MADDWFESDFDPFDILNENSVMINRLVKAHNGHDDLLNALAQNHSKMSDHILNQDKRIRQLERQIRALLKNETE